MKANELRIGNWVESPYGIRQIREIGITEYGDYARFDGHNNGYYLSEVCPIPLIEEILLKCGFGMVDDQYYLIIQTGFASHEIYFEFEFVDKEIFGSIWIGDESETTRKIFIEIKYLHELQNLYFALTNKELEVKL